ncbi:nuclear matrix constituent protein 1a-like isoform X2 [Ischnura elegans]|uniref:nuclear matrix constituent protein 1a-like isoform X2 n=1 Tax=Ischnura elegans TaxID=197161 RepID=UPI001ED87578|nr:nuclear matrix constituent protein 1a-like isoform X2 [Ischnura elegans]
MQIFRWDVVYFMMLLSVGLVAVTVADTEDEDESNLSRIIFEDINEDDDNYLVDEIEEFQMKLKEYEEEMKLYEEEMEEFLKSKTKHEAEAAAVETLHSDSERKLKEYKDIAEENKNKFEADWRELEADELLLTKREEKLVEEENDLAMHEAKDADSERELKEIIAASESLEAYLGQQTKELHEFKQNLQRNATEEEKRLKALYGICEPVHSEFRQFLRVFDEDYTRMCYKPIHNA